MWEPEPEVAGQQPPSSPTRGAEEAWGPQKGLVLNASRAGRVRGGGGVSALPVCGEVFAPVLHSV